MMNDPDPLIIVSFTRKMSALNLLDIQIINMTPYCLVWANGLATRLVKLFEMLN